jgi:RecA/RadA recombinase
MGMDIDFMTNDRNPAYAAVFQGQDIDAYSNLLRYYQQYGKVPETSLFRRSFPSESYRIVDSNFDDRELTDLARDSIALFETEVGTTKAQALWEAGKAKEAALIMQETARRVLHQQARAAVTVSWDRKDFDLEDRLSLVRSPAPGFGIEALDDQFPGFGDGQLITLVGRAKAGKTTIALQSAYHAWFGRKTLNRAKTLEPRRVLFTSIEVPEQDVRDILTCYGAEVNPAPFLASTDDYRLSQHDQDKIRKFWDAEMTNATESFIVTQPVAKFTLADLEYEIEKAEPEILYIDGFYFMTDADTGRTPGASWEAHDNLARELKALAMRNRIPVIVTHQAREKQLGKAGGGFDDIAMMGGTGLRMASDMVFTIDKGEDGVVTVKNTAARRGYVKSVKGEWDWDIFRFSAYAYKEEDETGEDY